MKPIVPRTAPTGLAEYRTRLGCLVQTRRERSPNGTIHEHVTLSCPGMVLRAHKSGASP